MIAAKEAPAPAAPDSPYKLLDYFGDSPEDRLRFGGREREIRELVASITNESTLVVYGPSGIGKTSLLLAGVFPVLRERGYRTLYARTLVQPLEDLRKAIAEGCDLGELRPEEDLRSLVARATEEGPLVVVLDQFEEFFDRFRERPEDRAAFIAELASVLRDRSLCLTVVFSLREDRLASLDEFNPKLPEPLADRRYRLQPMTAFGARQAIAKPLVRAGIEHEPAVISGLLAQLEQVGFEPLLLQILCSELYREAARRAGGGVPRITVEDLEQLGGTDGIFRRYLNGSVEALPRERHLLARMILDALIASESTRRAATLTDLLQARFSARDEEVREILDLLTAQRLLRYQERDGQGWYELIHERLIPVLKSWLDFDQEFTEFRQARDFVRHNCEGELWRRSPETLLNKWVLDKLLGPHQERFRFNERELELVLRSALYRRFAGVAFWAQRYGGRKAIDLVEQLALSGSEGERRGAVASAGALQDQDPEGRLAGLCVRVALEDESEPVRRAAGLSLARLAREEDLARLASALADRALGKRAREALANMYAGGHSLARFGRVVRFHSRYKDRERVFREHHQTLLARRMTGLMHGALAGLPWVVVFPFLIAFVVAMTAEAGTQGPWGAVRDVFSSVGWIAILIVPALAGGMLLGGLASNAAARHAALHQEEGRWLSALWRSPSFFCGALLPGWALLKTLQMKLVTAESTASFLFFDFLSHWFREALGVLFVAALIHLVFALVVHFSRPAVWPGVSKVGIWIWSFLLGLGLPLLPTVVALFLLRHSPDPGWPLELLAWTSLLFGFGSSVALVALARSAARHPLYPPPASSQAVRWRCRAATAVLVLVNLVLSVLGLLLKG